MTTAVVVSVSPRVLVWAREHCSAKLPEAAERCHHSVEELAAWELGESEPPLAALRDLAHFYGIPLSVFLLPAQPDVPSRPVDLRVVAGVVTPEASVDLAKALNRTAALQEMAGELLDSGVGVAFRPISTGQEDPEALAEAQRTQIGIALDEQRKWRDERTALRAWRQALESQGVFVLQLPLDRSEVRAFSLSQRPPFIVLNQSDFVRSRIFSLFHEYGHVLLGSGAICIPGSGRRAMEHSSSIEVFCNRFAGAFLVPAGALRNDRLAAFIASQSTPPEDDVLEHLARRFHVSWAVVWFRMRHLGMISQDLFRQKWADWDWYPMPKGGGGGMTTAERVLATYGSGLTKLVLSASERNLVTAADAGQYLTFPTPRLGDVEMELTSRVAV